MAAHERGNGAVGVLVPLTAIHASPAGFDVHGSQLAAVYGEQFQELLQLLPEDFTIEGSAGVTNGAYITKDKTGGSWIFKPTDEESFRTPEEVEQFKLKQLEYSEYVEDTLVEPVGVESQSAIVPYDSACGHKTLAEIEKIAQKNGVVWGESTRKEIAAYLLDHGHFAGVPLTLPMHVKVRAEEVKAGSLQQFIKHVAAAEDMGSSRFSPEQVHKIGILDVRLLNLDRHLGNILVSTHNGECILTPIDHGYILPDFREATDVSFEWLYWKQCRQPFSQRTLDYIRGLHAYKDAVTLKRLGLSDGTVLTNVLSTMLLQRGAARGLCLYDIASMLQRMGFGDEKAVFEKAVDRTVKRVADKMEQERETARTRSSPHRRSSTGQIRHNHKHRERVRIRTESECSTDTEEDEGDTHALLPREGEEIAALAETSALTEAAIALAEFTLAASSASPVSASAFVSASAAPSAARWPSDQENKEPTPEPTPESNSLSIAPSSLTQLTPTSPDSSPRSISSSNTERLSLFNFPVATDAADGGDSLTNSSTLPFVSGSLSNSPPPLPFVAAAASPSGTGSQPQQSWDARQLDIGVFLQAFAQEIEPEIEKRAPKPPVSPVTPPRPPRCRAVPQ